MEKVSKERIAVELTKLLLSDYPEQMEAVFYSGIAPFVSRSFPKAESGLIGLERMKSLPKEKTRTLVWLPSGFKTRRGGFHSSGIEA